MGLPDFSVKKPVTTVMIFLGVALFGIISIFKLPQELFPPIKYPQLTVFTVYANAAPQEVETLITKPIEEAVGTVSGLKSVRSISREGLSLVFAEFSWDQNMDFASLGVREKIDLIKVQLPRDSSEPLVVLYNPFEMPIMRVSVTGERSPMELRKLAVDIIKEEIEKVDGVASASVEGGLDREIVVRVNHGKLQAYDVPILDVADVITNANLNYPAGTIKESFYEYLIRTLGEFESVSEIEKVAVRTESGHEQDENLPFEEKMEQRKISRHPRMVTIGDLAEIEDTVKERSSYSRQNSEENVSVAVQKQAQTNTLQVVNEVRNAFKQMRKKLPRDVKLKVVYDQSSYIKDAINGVRDAAWQGGILTFLVLLFFLRDFAASGIITVAIPISIMVVFPLMYFAGLSLNIMSLGGLALGVGMLVDNGIVVIENIFRRRELGESAEESAVKGSEEVLGAIMGSTLTTIAVFLPMIFVVGVTGQLFKELAFTITFSLLGSVWVALTLVPLLSCKLGAKGDVKKSVEGFAGGTKWKMILERYKNFLRAFIAEKNKGLILTVLVFTASLFLFNFLEKELIPKTDQGEFMVKVNMPAGTIVAETNRVALLIEEVIGKEPSVESISAVVGSTVGETAKDIVKSRGSHQAEIMVALKPRRSVRTGELVQKLQGIFSSKKYTPARIEVIMQQGVMSGAFGAAAKPVTVEIKGEDLSVMAGLAKGLEKNFEKIPGLFGIEDDIPESSPEIRMNIDKDKASLYNLSVVDLARIAQILLKGYTASRFKEKGKEYDIRVTLRDEDRDTLEELYRVRVNSPTAGKIALSTVAKFEKGVGPSEIRRISQERTITVSANIVSRKMADVMKDVEKAIGNMKEESGYRVRAAGESEEMKKSFTSLQFALILSLVLVYMIMAAQFESLSQPFIILFTVPLSIIGVMLALFTTNTSVSAVSMLGVIMLGGIVVNNGIVMIDFTNILMRGGMDYRKAIVEAAATRLRPILMTALTTILGLVPMAIAVGRGSELRAPLAISVMGGLTVSTFLTLFVIPTIFVLDGDLRAKFAKKK